MAYNFGPAALKEKIIFGASMPGLMHSYPVPDEIVTEWMQGMQKHGIQRVCCLLPSQQFGNFASSLLNQYADFFGVGNVCWAPIPDFHLSDPQTLENIILPFLVSSVQIGSPTVVHCAGGVGRTGHILAAWLVYGRGYTPLNALTSVSGTSATRNPYEAIHFGNATIEQLKALLDIAANLAADSA